MHIKTIAATLAAASTLALANPAAGQSLTDSIERDMPELMELYRELHANPELSMQETLAATRGMAHVGAVLEKDDG